MEGGKRGLNRGERGKEKGEDIPSASSNVIFKYFIFRAISSTELDPGRSPGLPSPPSDPNEDTRDAGVMVKFVIVVAVVATEAPVSRRDSPPALKMLWTAVDAVRSVPTLLMVLNVPWREWGPKPNSEGALEGLRAARDGDAAPRSCEAADVSKRSVTSLGCLGLCRAVCSIRRKGNSRSRCRLSTLAKNESEHCCESRSRQILRCWSVASPYLLLVSVMIEEAAKAPTNCLPRTALWKSAKSVRLLKTYVGAWPCRSTGWPLILTLCAVSERPLKVTSSSLWFLLFQVYGYEFCLESLTGRG